LLVARSRYEWIAPVLFQGSVTAPVFEQWLTEQLLPSLTQPSVLVLDNAAFHRPAVVTKLMEQAGHRVLFLPPYSPDLNPIEGDFAAVKKTRAYESAETALDELVASYQPKAGRPAHSYKRAKRLIPS
jgi:transposase